MLYETRLISASVRLIDVQTVASNFYIALFTIPIEAFSSKIVLSTVQIVISVILFFP